MSPTRREQSEADWDAWKSTIRRLYLHQKRPLKSVLEYLQENGFNASKAQLWYKLDQWGFRRNMDGNAWNFVRHRISKRERAGKKSDVVLSGVRLRPEVVHRETLRNRPLPKLGRAQISPSPEPPSNLPLIVCSPLPMEITFNWPQTLPWIQFRTMIQEYEWKDIAGHISYSSSLALPLSAHNFDIINAIDRYVEGPSIVSNTLVSEIIWNPQCPSKISAHIGLVIPELWEGENLARADILISGSGSEKLRHILEIFIATVSNNIAEWEDIEANWNILQYVLAQFLGPISNYKLLESQTMKAFSDNLFRLAFDAAVYALSNREVKPNAQISHQVITWLLHAGYNPNRPHRNHNSPKLSHDTINHKVSPLQQAVTFGDRFQTMVQLLLEFGADINAGDDDGTFSALQLVLDEHAMRYWTGSTPRVVYLQEVFTDRAIKGHNWKELQILAEHAIRHGNKDLLQSLFMRGFNLDFRQYVDFGLSSEVTAITCAVQFCPSSREGPWDGWLYFVLSLIPQNKRDLPSQFFIDPLICAAGAGNNAAIHRFLGFGGLLDAQNEIGIFPLIAAVAHGQADTCKLLLSLGADGSKTGLNGLSAIHVAAMTGSYEIIQLLTKGTEDKKGTIMFTRELEYILLRLDISNIPNFVRGIEYTALDIVVHCWTAERVRAEESEECFKHLLRNGFYLSPPTFEWCSSWIYYAFPKDHDLLEALADTYLGTHPDTHSTRDNRQECSLKYCIGRCAIYSQCTGVIKKYFENCWELQSDVLFSALSEGDIETAKFVLSLGVVDIKTKRREDPPFLELAILSNDQNTIDWALAADPEHYDPRALCAAVQIALEKEPILCYKEVLARRPQSLVADPLESTAVGIAASGDNMQLLRDLLFAVPPSPNCLVEEYQLREPRNTFPSTEAFWRDRSHHRRGCGNGSPLTYAVGPGREKNFSLLLEHGYRPDSLTLLCAIRVGSLEQIKYIYSSGLVDWVGKSLSYRPTPEPKIPLTMSILLQAAAYRNRTDVVRWLLAQDLKVDDWRGNYMFGDNSPLGYAVENGNLELVNILLKHGAPPNEKPGKFMGMTALQLAAQKGFIGIAKILIDHDPPADVNAHYSPPFGSTALESASASGHLDMVQFLLSSGAKTEGTRQRQYIRAIRFAQQGGYVEVANILKAHRQWTQRDEELFRNEDVEQSPINVHESECSDSECEFPHEYTRDSDDSEDSESDDDLSTSADMEESGGIVHEFECSDSQRELPHTLADNEDREGSDIEGREYGNDDSVPTSADGGFTEDDTANDFLEGTSTSWAEVMTLEEAEAAFISYDDD